MQKLPVEILTDNLKLEVLGLYDAPALDVYAKENMAALDEMTFTRSLTDALFEDKTLEYYAARSYYNFRQKKNAEYLIVEKETEKIIGYFDMRMKQSVGETYLWIHPNYRGRHLTGEIMTAVEKSFFETGLSAIDRSCSPHNPYFDKIAAYMPLAGYRKVEKNETVTYPTWRKTREAWLIEQQRKEIQNQTLMSATCIKKGACPTNNRQKKKYLAHS